MALCPCALTVHSSCPEISWNMQEIWIIAWKISIFHLLFSNISLMPLQPCGCLINIINILRYDNKNMHHALTAWAGWENKTQHVIQWTYAQFIISPYNCALMQKWFRRRNSSKYVKLESFLLCDTKKVREYFILQQQWYISSQLVTSGRHF